MGISSSIFKSVLRLLTRNVFVLLTSNALRHPESDTIVPVLGYIAWATYFAFFLLHFGAFFETNITPIGPSKQLNLGPGKERR